MHIYDVVTKMMVCTVYTVRECLQKTVVHWQPGRNATVM